MFNVAKLFYKLYFVKFSNAWIDQKYLNLLIKIANRFFPFYYKLTKPEKIEWQNTDEKYIISLTTFPARIEKVWLTIQSLLRQTYKPDKIILWLAEDEFENNTLPTSVLNLEKYGVEIRFCQNLKPHKKYFFALKEFPDANIITVDDDMIYHPDLLHNLIKLHQQFPKAICCSMTRRILITDGIVMPYDTWQYVKTNEAPSNSLLVMGGGGTLFPPDSFHKNIFNLTYLVDYSLTTDDLWLKIMSVLKGSKVANNSGIYPRFFIPIMVVNNKRLMDENISNKVNDKVFNKLIDIFNVPISSLKD